jgi:hypothetical protein
VLRKCPWRITVLLIDLSPSQEILSSGADSRDVSAPAMRSVTDGSRTKNPLLFQAVKASIFPNKVLDHFTITDAEPWRITASR